MDLQGTFDAETVKAARGGHHEHKVYVCYECGTVAVERTADNAGITWVYPDGTGATSPKQEPDKEGNVIGTFVVSLPKEYFDALREGRIRGGFSVQVSALRKQEIAAPAKETRSAMLCEHANENPGKCACAEDCYCKTHTCKDRDIPAKPAAGRTEFERELQDLLNRHSKENDSDTPDFVLAAYLQDCLNAFERATRHRERWHWGESQQGRSTQR